jgi:hypothetical protein
MGVIETGMRGTKMAIDPRRTRSIRQWLRQNLKAHAAHTVNLGKTETVRMSVRKKRTHQKKEAICPSKQILFSQRKQR